MPTEKDIIEAELNHIASQMVIAARTAPKGKGVNNLIIDVVERDDIKRIASHLIAMGESLELPAFVRDGHNIMDVSVMVLFGSTISSLGLQKCGLCGFSGCEEKNKHPRIPCAFNTGDLGIAIGSAASVAMDHRVDTRIMYTVGQAVLDMNYMGEEIKIAYAIPLSATSKNPFFDRK